jgi:hypothetical protein
VIIPWPGKAIDQAVYLRAVAAEYGQAVATSLLLLPRDTIPLTSQGKPNREAIRALGRADGTSSTVGKTTRLARGLHRQGAQARQPSQIDSADAGQIGLTLQFQANFRRTYFQRSALLKNLCKIQFAFELLKLLLNFVFTSGDLELVDIIEFDCRSQTKLAIRHKAPMPNRS